MQLLLQAQTSINTTVRNIFLFCDSDTKKKQPLVAQLLTLKEVTILYLVAYLQESFSFLRE